MNKHLTRMALAMSILGLVGCSGGPGAPKVTGSTQNPNVVVAAVGQHGANVTLNFGQSLLTQAIAHRWVKADIVRYDVVLKDVTGAPVHLVTTPVPKDKTGVTFSGLALGKVYRAYVEVKGNKGGIAGGTLQLLNADTLETENTGHVVYNFQGDNDIEDTVAKTVNLQFDDVDFDGKGSLTINQPEDGNFVDVGGTPTVTIIP